MPARTERCHGCGGLGKAAGTGFTCPVCGGLGTVVAVPDGGPYGETMRDKRRAVAGIPRRMEPESVA